MENIERTDQAELNEIILSMEIYLICNRKKNRLQHLVYAEYATSGDSAWLGRT